MKQSIIIMTFEWKKRKLKKKETSVSRKHMYFILEDLKFGHSSIIITDNMGFPKWARVHPVAESLLTLSQTHKHTRTRKNQPPPKVHPHHKLQFSCNQNTLLC